MFKKKDRIIKGKYFKISKASIKTNSKILILIRDDLILKKDKEIRDLKTEFGSLYMFDKYSMGLLHPDYDSLRHLWYNTFKDFYSFKIKIEKIENEIKEIEIEYEKLK